MPQRGVSAKQWLNWLVGGWNGQTRTVCVAIRGSLLGVPANQWPLDALVT